MGCKVTMTYEPRKQDENTYDRYPPWLRTNITPFQVGMDALSFSSTSPIFSLPSAPESFPPRLEAPQTMGAYLLKGAPRRRPTERFPWALRVEYLHQPHGHRLIMFTHRSQLCVPLLFLKLIPAPGRLLSPQDVLHLLAPLSAYFSLNLGHLKVSQVELAADFDVDVRTFEGLGRVMWVPRTRWPRRVGNNPPTFYWGSRRSSCQTKLYMKGEAGRSYGRLEHTFRRNALRRMGVHRPTDLLTFDWARAASRRGRFVELDIVRRTPCPPSLAVHLRAFLLSMGLKRVIRPNSARYQRWMKSRFIPLPVQSNLEAALATLSATSVRKCKSASTDSRPRARPPPSRK